MLASLKKPSAILFDWDNTLVHTWPSIHKAINIAFEKYGLEPWSLEKVKSNAHESSREAFPKLFGSQWQEAQDFFYKHVRSTHLTDLKIMPGSFSLLNYLRQKGVTLGVVSNKGSDLLKDEINHLKWSDFFQAVVGAGEAEKDKPAPDPINLALARVGLAASDSIWFVGDTVVDWQSAQASGCQPIAIGERAQSDISVPYVADCHQLHSFLTRLCEVAG
jgi:phosphoglycolate phosphatase